MVMDLQWFNFAPNGQVQTFVDSFINRTLLFHFWDGDIGETIILMLLKGCKLVWTVQHEILLLRHCNSNSAVSRKYVLSFFNSRGAANLNFCTKCFEDRLVEEQAAIAKAKMEDSFNSKSTK
ncbi:uncharacterized protein LOC116110074 [Pistacia vera]|uniref:uncharacterized protein LOC116110074 n=1 Tax=Pistacia vera TaxID=55513 RepID=UPI00126366E5|nr:uncharacterized protein LOC116110074 [Pistacia vera]